jgi:hypothetical protein
MTDHVRVSMYNVGFGDCFLLRFPDQENGGERRVLIDCGSIKRPVIEGSPVDIDKIAERIVADVADDGGPRIDVVVMSHRHRDHVSGFTSDVWRDVRVDEVWMPWTENPRDAKARRLLHDMSSFTAALTDRFAALSALGQLDDPETQFIDHVLRNTMGLTNERALATLHRGFLGGSQGAARKFMSRGSSVQARPTEALPGVDVYVLAPSREESVITEMDPPTDESFLRAVMESGDEQDGPIPLSKEFEARLWDPEKDGDPPAVAQPLLDLLADLSSSSALLAAAALEKAVNNTSLMLAFEIGDATLLFPGDSQWGSWQINLEDDQARALLTRTSFYKVGHHGSHNSNPKSLLASDDMTRLWGAATSVTKHGRFEKIPEPDLMNELVKKLRTPGDETRLVRSDQPPYEGMAPDGVTVVDDFRIDFEVPIG